VRRRPADREPTSRRGQSGSGSWRRPGARSGRSGAGCRTMVNVVPSVSSAYERPDPAAPRGPGQPITSAPATGPVTTPSSLVRDPGAHPAAGSAVKSALGLSCQLGLASAGRVEQPGDRYVLRQVVVDPDRLARLRRMHRDGPPGQVIQCARDRPGAAGSSPGTAPRPWRRGPGVLPRRRAGCRVSAWCRSRSSPIRGHRPGRA